MSKLLILSFYRNLVSGSSETGIKKLIPKGMALTQWKFLNYIKEYYVKHTSSESNMYQVANKEFAKLLQKMQPTIYGDHLIRQLESKNDAPAKPKKPDASYNIPKVLTDLKLRIGISEVAVNKPKWLTNNPTISQKSITAKTKQIVTLIALADSDQSKIQRIDDLITHILNFPEGRHQAVKVCHLILNKIAFKLYSIKY